MHIRPATPDDAPGIAAIVNHEIRTGLAIWRNDPRPVSEIEALIQTRLAAGEAVLVADGASDGIMGWATYGPFRAYEGYALTKEHSVHIAPDHRRKGIASALMPVLLDHADAAGVHALIGCIDATNTGSIDLHRRLDFHEVGRMPEIGRKFDRWLTLVLMQRLAGSSITEI
jgi:phosphinothricin acetyltransferase